MGGRVYVPLVHRCATTRRVLTTEWVEGKQLAASPPAVIRRLVPVGVECFFTQLIDTGFFHSDPHPGNLLVTTDGRLALIDFGLCATVPMPAGDVIARAVVHLLNGDLPELLHDAAQLGFLPNDPYYQLAGHEGGWAWRGQDALLVAELGELLEEALLTGRDAASSQRRRAQLRAVSGRLNRLFFDYPFTVPDYFALITRALIVLEGIALVGDPDFDIFAAAHPHAARRVGRLLGTRGAAAVAFAAHSA